ncbi:Alpha/Beta hydrolase protein [Xylariaceae sp. FL0804]|nr:Alpha/Beta hydrolase protein [Xylariaceae sp. FL0804]
MPLPRPSLSFALPSVHDGTRLDCRIYHPAPLVNGTASAAAAAAPEWQRCWQRHAAVVAHPYAPLGGSYDDPIVDLVAAVLLQRGFVVATFNFRGASSFGGRTSWTSRPERADYASVVGFLAYYVHYLDPPGASSSSSSSPSAPPPPPPPLATSATGTGPAAPPPTMLLAGYSYGAMVATKLEPLDALLAGFATPAVGSAAADVRLRAQHLAAQQSALLAVAPPESPRRSLGMRIGGVCDEDTDNNHHHNNNNSNNTPSRKSHDRGGGGRLPPSPDDREERIRSGVKDLLARTKLISKRHCGGGGEGPEQPRRETDKERERGREKEMVMVDPCLERVPDLAPFRSAYLAVSPPVGLVTSLATMSFATTSPLSLLTWPLRRPFGRGVGPATATAAAVEVEEITLAKNPSLVVYGGQDGFVTPRKMREWTAQLSRAAGSRFEYVEVAGAGHFWVEEGALRKLRTAVDGFARGLLVRE